MPNYIVRVREEHIVDYFIEAKDEQQAKEFAENPTKVQDTMEIDSWVNNIQSVEENK